MRVWLDSRRALMLFMAVALTFVMALFSMPSAVARLAQPDMIPIGAGAAEAATRSPSATLDAGGALVGQQHSSTADLVIRLAAETRERPREVFDPHDSPLDESRYYPGRGYDVPWDRDPLFGETRHSLASLVSAVRGSPAETRPGRTKAVVKQRKIRMPHQGFGATL
jgi:hypothetical protein